MTGKFFGGVTPTPKLSGINPQILGNQYISDAFFICTL